MDLKPGEMLGEYKIVVQLGRGGMAVVYKAYQPTLERNVALKVLPQQFTFDAEFVNRFLHEARIAANLQHPHIVKIYQVSESAPYHIAMEFIDGSTLYTFLSKHGPMRPERAAAILSQVADALAYAHAHGVIHRDLKASNIMVNARGNAVLLDFGIARAVQATRMTATGIVMGTPEYMAPEMTQGSPTTAAADIYALGIVAYEMLTGSVPFRGETTQAILFQHAYNPVPSLRQFGIDVSPSLENVLRKALAKTPAQRYPDALSFARDFEKGARGEAVLVSAPLSGEENQTVGRSPNRTPLIIAGVAIVAAVLILALLFLPLLLAPPASPAVPFTPVAAGGALPNAVGETPVTFAPASLPSQPTGAVVGGQSAGTLPSVTSLPSSTPEGTATAAAAETRLAELVAATVNAQAAAVAEIATTTAAAQQTETALQPTITPTATRRPATPVPPTNTPTEAPPTATRTFFGVRLVSPADREVFGNENQPPLLEWKAAVTGNLAAEEWYRIQVGHNGPPICNLYTKELFYQLPPSGQSGEGCNPESWRFNTGDFVWRVSLVVRVDGDVSHDKELGNSEGRLFKWNKQ